jgi:outer membrane receptor protein involved in Fe transport
MTRNTEIARAVRYAILMGAVTVAAASLPVQAQQAADQEETTLATVVVTGSRIPQPNLEAISPVTAVSSDEIKLTGATRVEDLLNNLPQVMAAQGGNLANGASGTAQVDLRGLGTQRTLVLVNSRRLMPGDPTINGAESPDLNQIPAALIDRVDVLTGGASAVYGADAVAGVVNFIMNDHFQGVRIDANGSVYQHDQKEGWLAPLYEAENFKQAPHSVSPGTGKDVTVILGNNFADDAGNVTMYAGYRQLQPILQSQYDYSACSLNGGSSFVCGGSSTSPTGRFININPLTGNASDNNLGPGGALVPFNPANDFNYGALNYYQRPDERYTAGAFAHLKLNEHAEAYMEFMFMDDNTTSQVAPSGAFGEGFSVNCNNPLLSASEVSTWCTQAGLGPTGNATVYILRRNVEGGDRLDNLTHTSYRTVLGLRGEIAPGWKYDTYVMDGTSRLAEIFSNDVSGTKVQNALDAIASPTGPVCANAAAIGCVPYNVFSLHSVSPAAAGYISSQGFSGGYTTERIFNATATGDLGYIKTPWAKDGLGVAIGTEYRQEKSQISFDQEYLNQAFGGDLLGQGGYKTDTGGQFHVWEAITEARMPLIQDAPFTKSLDLEAGYRYSSYTEGFTTNTYKIGLQWSPIDDFHFRGSYQQAVRAPNIQELFRPDAVALDGSTDPCSGPHPTGSVAGCAAAGVPASAYGTVVANPAGQYNGLEGGNTALQPEKSKTKSFGIVFTPAFLNGFTASVDYFDINIEGTIGAYGGDFILGQCIATQSPMWCNDIHRNAGNNYSLWLGTTGYVTDTNFNTGALETKGVDLTADYRLNMGRAGKLSFDLLTTYTANLLTTPVSGGATYDCAGYYGTTCGVPDPRWRSKMRTTWGTPLDGLDLSADWRHFGQVALDATSANPLLNHAQSLSSVQANSTTDLRLGSRDYIDLVAVYTHSKITYRFGVNNVFDKDPPLAGSEIGGGADGVFYSGNTFPNVYDSLGRFLFLNITADF